MSLLADSSIFDDEEGIDTLLVSGTPRLLGDRGAKRRTCCAKSPGASGWSGSTLSRSPRPTVPLPLFGRYQRKVAEIASL
jgi:hypothetical protein